MGDLQVIKDVIIPLGVKPLKARGEAASKCIIVEDKLHLNLNVWKL